MSHLCGVDNRYASGTVDEPLCIYFLVTFTRRGSGCLAATWSDRIAFMALGAYQRMGTKCSENGKCFDVVCGLAVSRSRGMQRSNDSWMFLTLYYVVVGRCVVPRNKQCSAALSIIVYLRWIIYVDRTATTTTIASSIAPGVPTKTKTTIELIV